jgi:hypothetical protein
MTTTTLVQPVPRLMKPNVQTVIGTLCLIEGFVALIVLVGAYGLAERLVSAQEGAEAGDLATRTLHWWGPDYTVTLNMSLLLVGAAAAAAGSVVQQSLVFALRSGQENLERGYVWWYVLRPSWSALLGAITVVAVNAGTISIGDATTSAAGVSVLVAAGALAGLFTDRVLQMLQASLGATDTSAPASTQPLPVKGAAPAPVTSATPVTP